MSTLAVTTPAGTRTFRLGPDNLWAADVLNTGTARSSRVDFPVSSGTQIWNASSLTLGPIVTLGTPPNQWKQRTLTVVDGNGTRTFDLNADTGMLGIAVYDDSAAGSQVWFKVADITSFVYTR